MQGIRCLGNLQGVWQVAVRSGCIQLPSVSWKWNAKPQEVGTAVQRPEHCRQPLLPGLGGWQGSTGGRKHLHSLKPTHPLCLPEKQDGSAFQTLCESFPSTECMLHTEL